MENKTYIKFTDVNVDGCGTDVETIMEINTDTLTNGTIERVKKAIMKYKDEYEYEWDTDGCLNAAVEQLEVEGYKVKYCIPTTEICF